MALERNREQVREVLAGFRMCNPRIFESTARGEDTDTGDLDILIDAPPKCAEAIGEAAGSSMTPNPA
jgi:predicted nucleotidyltransferase